jgi:hypothetical protein
MTPDERMAAAKEALAGCSGWPEGRCQSGKRMYKSRRDAMARKHEQEVKIRYSKKAIRFNAYHCKECDWWHLATRNEQ